ncbi:MAG: tRNA lysidine(34) synthetase TilS [Bacteroidota bacterium]|nr:tRNA lysidine(34) synthetase TilS [Bacteroidota bacterium]
MQTELLDIFLEEVQIHGKSPTSTYLLAVSGGVDSVVLTELAKQANLNFSIAHCNFNLRGEESKRDEGFVQQLAEKYNIPSHIKQFDTNSFAIENKLSIQEAARKLRYDWFDELRKENNFSHIIIAHHADDNIETVLMNFFRGTGLNGLTGMAAYYDSKKIMRPLISVRRKEIEVFAQKHNLPWVEDSSNAEAKYTRNYFRNELIPALKRIYPQVEENILDTIERLKKTSLLHDQLADQLKKKLNKGTPPEARFSVKELMKYKNTSLLYDILKDFGFTEKQVPELMKLAQSETGKFLTNNDYILLRDRAWFVFSPKQQAAKTIVILKEDKTIPFTGGVLKIELIQKEKTSISTSPDNAQLDASEIEFPLILRRWREGDYFYPLGMRKKKKIARFFIDQKLSKLQKEKTWVLESHKRIIWVVGYRIDHRFKLTANSGEVLQLTISIP